MESVAFSLAGRPVLLHSEFPGLVGVLRATWAPALVPVGALGAARGALVLQALADGTLVHDGQSVGRSSHAGTLASLLEGHLLALALEENKAFFQLHAGAVVFGQYLLLLLGEAGAGKSTFTREALKLGASYITDDTLICEPGRFRGVARTVHFDSVMERNLANLPSHFQDCDVTSSKFIGNQGDTWVVPLWRGAFRTLTFFSPSPQKVVVLQITQSKRGSVTSLSPLERAAALLGASLASASPDLRMVPDGPALSVEWHDDPAGMLRHVLMRVGVPF